VLVRVKAYLQKLGTRIDLILDENEGAPNPDSKFISYSRSSNPTACREYAGLACNWSAGGILPFSSCLLPRAD
jgi:hypothetical protein